MDSFVLGRVEWSYGRGVVLMMECRDWREKLGRDGANCVF